MVLTSATALRDMSLGETMSLAKVNLLIPQNYIITDNLHNASVLIVTKELSFSLNMLLIMTKQEILTFTL